MKKTGFRICGNKGFHVTFENGWTVSVQFGAGSYCDNYDEDILAIGEPSSSSCAETAVIAPSGELVALSDGADTVQGYQSPAEVLRLLNETAAR